MLRQLALFLGLLLAVSCGRGTDRGKVFVPGQGHRDTWASYLAVGQTTFHGSFVRTVPDGASGAGQFALHCAPCHGDDGAGKIGPNIQQAPLSNITAAIQAIPVMRGHAVLSEEQLRDIASHIATLATTSQPAGSFDTTLCTQCHGEGLDGGIARVSCFSCHNGPDGSVGHPGGWSSVTVAGSHGVYGKDFIEGCKVCHRPDLNGGGVFASVSGFAPACAGCHDGVTAPVL